MKQPTQTIDPVKVSKDKFEQVTDSPEEESVNNSTEPDDNGNYFNEGFENNESGSEYETDQEIEPFENQRKSPKSKVLLLPLQCPNTSFTINKSAGGTVNESCCKNLTVVLPSEFFLANSNANSEISIPK